MIQPHNRTFAHRKSWSRQCHQNINNAKGKFHRKQTRTRAMHIYIQVCTGVYTHMHAYKHVLVISTCKGIESHSGLCDEILSPVTLSCSRLELFLVQCVHTMDATPLLVTWWPHQVSGCLSITVTVLFYLMMTPGHKDSEAGNADMLKLPLCKKGQVSIIQKTLCTDIPDLQ